MNFESKSIRNGQTWEREKCLLRFLEGNQNQDQEKMALHLQKAPFNIKQEGSKKKG